MLCNYEGSAYIIYVYEDEHACVLSFSNGGVYVVCGDAGCLKARERMSMPLTGA